MTLYNCIASINNSTYPVEMIEVLLVDNGSKDNSFDEFQRAQIDFLSWECGGFLPSRENPRL